ncbi:MAG: 2-C-methyl-D-erythritol 4-phosphate cytidylyltransferase [Eggerthellaceae bacterium]|nr:2-C-methyl-D-erythritol 4-phosphate cytidylyltransferase [Eggerthellaceae bacterium]
MNFAAILAGGHGTRMGATDKPKQFQLLGERPILVHTLEKFALMDEFERVLLLCPVEWVEASRDLLKMHLPAQSEKIVVLAGGATRSGTVQNAIAWIEENYETDENTVIVTHDSVRPFVTYRIIKDNLEALANYDACDTVIPASDTIVVSEGGTEIDSIPLRSTMFQGQTPQSFRLLALKEVYEQLSGDEEAQLTDACKAFVLRGRPVALVNGEPFNIKITYPVDLRIAHALLGQYE